jgi:hypothetical protein
MIVLTYLQVAQGDISKEALAALLSEAIGLQNNPLN